MVCFLFMAKSFITLGRRAVLRRERKKQMKVFKKFNGEAVKCIGRGGVGIIPTDTIYGMVGSALLKKAVEKIYRLRRRNPKKPPIILISGIKDLKLFCVKLDKKTAGAIRKLWPGKVSVVLPLDVNRKTQIAKWDYLHRGVKTLAFRVPACARLRKFLEKTGPLVAPSANPEGKDPAKNIEEAVKYFRNEVDFYIDGGTLSSKPSTLVAFDKKGGIKVLREGAVCLLRE